MATQPDPTGQGGHSTGVLDVEPAVRVTQVLERTTAVFPSRNMDVGQPSIGSRVARERSCGGQLFSTFSEPPESVKMRVPSFFMKSASSTPATCVFVVV